MAFCQQEGILARDLSPTGRSKAHDLRKVIEIEHEYPVLTFSLSLSNVPSGFTKMG